MNNYFILLYTIFGILRGFGNLEKKIFEHESIKKGDEFLFEKYQNQVLDFHYDYGLPINLDTPTPVKGVFVCLDLNGDNKRDTQAYLKTTQQLPDSTIITEPYAKKVFIYEDKDEKWDYVLVDEDDNKTLESKYNRKNEQIE